MCLAIVHLRVKMFAKHFYVNDVVHVREFPKLKSISNWRHWQVLTHIRQRCVRANFIQCSRFTLASWNFECCFHFWLKKKIEEKIKNSSMLFLPRLFASTYLFIFFILYCCFCWLLYEQRTNFNKIQNLNICILVWLCESISLSLFFCHWDSWQIWSLPPIRWLTINTLLCDIIIKFCFKFIMYHRIVCAKRVLNVYQCHYSH